MGTTDFNRLEVKKQILDLIHAEASKESSPISDLPYHFLEIVNPEPYVDDILVEGLDEQGEGLTDNLFFRCLQESADYLAYESFRAKIKEWQSIIADEAATAADREKAGANLARIGKVLADQGKKKGRPSKWSEHAPEVHYYYSILVNKLYPFVKEVREKDLSSKPKKKWDLFKERFPCWEKYAACLTTQRSAGEIAKAIIMEKYGMSKRTLLALLQEI